LAHYTLYIDDLIQDLRKSGYGTYIGKLFVGAIAYADDICLLSCSCTGLQKMLDICSMYGINCLYICIRFNPSKSQVMTIGRTAPVVSVIKLCSGYQK